MKMEEIALMQAIWDRFDKSMENFFNTISKENQNQREFILALVTAGGNQVLKGFAAIDPDQAVALLQEKEKEKDEDA